MPELHDLTLSSLAAHLTRREISAEEATAHALRRIAAFDGRDRLNAYVTVLTESALAEARASDRRRKMGAVRGRLDGVPVALKDLFDTAGVRTTAGSRILAKNVPSTDATVVRRLRAAGAVILGKTNMMEFAYGHPHPDVGETVNPWDLRRTAGGSSGGSAAAIAVGMSWGAFGSDTGGSIRSPAAYCGVTGFKPTYGLVSCAGVLPLAWTLDHAGPIAMTAEDCAILLTAVAGHDPADPLSAPASLATPAVESVAAFTSAPPTAPSLKDLRIGTLPRLFELTRTPGLNGVVERALSVLVELGAEVVEVDLDASTVNAIVPTIMTLYPVEAAAVHQRWLRARPADYGPAVRAGLEAALDVPAVAYAEAQRTRTQIAAAFAELFQHVDLLAWPAQPLVAPPLGTTDAVVTDGEGAAPTIEVEIGATGPANLTGEPALSIPCGFVDNLPVGLHLQGPRFADALVLRTAAAYQTATGIPPRPDMIA